MPARMTGKLELFVNIAIIVVAITLTAVLVKKFVFTAAPGVSASLDAVTPGTAFKLPQIDWAANGRTLVLVLATDCRYCEKSLPFYQKLSRETESRSDFKLVAVFPQDTAAAAQYLRMHEITAHQIVQAHPPSLGVGGTPTLLLVDQNGIISETWFGQLLADQEQAVFARLRGDGSGDPFAERGATLMLPVSR